MLGLSLLHTDKITIYFIFLKIITLYYIIIYIIIIELLDTVDAVSVTRGYRL
jgi:hypothetical protein